MTRSLLLVVLIWIAPAAVAAGADRTRIEQAIVAAVHARMGERLDVEVSDLRIDAPAEAGDAVVATLPPEARFGDRVHVILRMPRADGHATRAGSADAVVRATRQTWIATQPIAARQEIGAGDAERRALSLDGLRMQALPADVRGTRATRAIAPGQILLPHMLRPVPLVKRGDQVAMAVRIGDLQVSTLGVANADGRLGQAITVTNSDTGKAIVARVVGRGAVEVRHGS